MKEEPAILIPKIEPNKVESNAPVQQTNSVQVNQPVKKFSFRIRSKSVIISVAVLAIILFLAAPILVFTAKANKAYKQFLPIVQKFNIEDTNKLKNDLTLVKTSVSDLKRSYKLFSWMKIFPWVGKYIDDLGHSLTAGMLVMEAGDATITTIEPYLSVLGFSDKEDGNQTSQERIDFVINSIPEILPIAGEISEKFKKAEEEMSNINPNDYPEKFRGID